MVAKKRKSKRQTLQTKYKIQKRAKEHHKRLKKGSIQIGKMKKRKVDDRIPNAWPYKEELLKEIQTAKDKMEEVKQRQKEKRHEELVIYSYHKSIKGSFFNFS
jgi:nuclear GTP-binding protein